MNFLSGDDTFNQPIGVTQVPVYLDKEAKQRAADSEFRTVEAIEQSLDELQQLSKSLLDDEVYQFAGYDCVVPNDFKLTVVIPVYNEQATIRKVLGRICGLPFNKEIIIVDDCSTDDTRDILAEFASTDGINVILQEQNQGKGAALRTGFSAATGDVVIVQDADLEYSPSDIPTVVAPLINRECDVVYGSRFLGDEHRDKSWVHRLGNGVLTKASNITTGLHLTDMETCYKAFRRDVLTSVTIEQNRFGFEPEITAKLARRDVKFKEVPISYDARTYEEGKKIGVKDLFNAFYCIAKYGFTSD